MKVIAIGRSVKPLTDQHKSEVLPKEVPATLQLYLGGKIEQFFFMHDRPGVVFLMHVESVDEAKTITKGMPLVAEGVLEYEFLPVGPLSPLGLLLQ